MTKPLFSKPIPFKKMHGLGNDFVMIDGANLPDNTDVLKLESFAQAVCNRHFGIGADGLIIAAPPSRPEAFDIQFVYYNADGSRVEMCGNGMRCFALFVTDLGLIESLVFTAETPAGPIRPRVNQNRSVTVDMGSPVLRAADVPFVGTSADTMPVLNMPIRVLDKTIPISVISMGNPHCIIFQDDLAELLDPAVFGPALETHPAFPAKTNVEFVTQRDTTTFDVVVWERGCGFTQACGTGACAVGVAAQLLEKTANATNSQIVLPGGVLEISWQPPAPEKAIQEQGRLPNVSLQDIRQDTKLESVMMTGPATYVFEGELLPEVFKDLFAYCHLDTGACAFEIV